MYPQLGTGVVHYEPSAKGSGEEATGCWTYDLINHFFSSLCLDVSLECFPKNLTSEASLTLSNTSI